MKMNTKSRSMVFPSTIIKQPENIQIPIIKKTKIGYLQNSSYQLRIPSDKLDVILNNIPVLNADNNQETEIYGNLTIGGNLKIPSCNVKEDIHTRDLVVENDIVGFNAYFANNMNVARNISAPSANINLLTVGENIQVPAVETDNIYSNSDLNFNIPIDCVARFGNLQYSVHQEGLTLLTPRDIKSHRIFVVKTGLVINADASCDGIEITIYNDNVGPIIIRDERSIIKKLKPKKCVRITYLYEINQWI